MISFSIFVFVKQKTAYEMRISDWSSDVCSSDLSLKICSPMPPGQDVWIFQVVVWPLAVPMNGAPILSATPSMAAAPPAVIEALRKRRRPPGAPPAEPRWLRLALRIIFLPMCAALRGVRFYSLISLHLRSEEHPSELQSL